MSARHILYVAHRIPFPPDKGDKIRSWKTVEHLAKRYRVHLAAFVDDAQDFRHEEFLKTVCESVSLIPLDRRAAAIRSLQGFVSGDALSIPYYWDRRMERAIAIARKKDLVAEIAFSSSVAPYILTGAEAPVVVDLCDADSEKWRAYCEMKPLPMRGVYAREADRLARVETGIINRANAVLAISDGEAAILRSRRGVEKPVHIFRNGVDAEYFSPGAAALLSQSFDVIFAGAMDYWANVDAVLWFVKEIWPSVRTQASDASFAIAGANPLKKIKALDGVDGVTVTGRVDDVRPFLEAARISIAPMRIARGVQNKVLEAMAMARPVIATQEALEGIAWREGEAIIANAPQQFANEIIALLRDRARAAKIGAAARNRILADYRWDTQFAALDSVIKGICETPGL